MLSLKKDALPTLVKDMLGAEHSLYNIEQTVMLPEAFRKRTTTDNPEARFPTRKDELREKIAQIQTDRQPDFLYGDVTHLTSNELESTLTRLSRKTVFVRFYAPWCPYSKGLEASWRQFAFDMRDHPNLMVVDVDADTERTAFLKKHCGKFFPVLKLFRAGGYGHSSTVYSSKDVSALALCNFVQRFRSDLGEQLVKEVPLNSVDRARACLRKAAVRSGFQSTLWVTERNLLGGFFGTCIRPLPGQKGIYHRKFNGCIFNAEQTTHPERIALVLNEGRKRRPVVSGPPKKVPYHALTGAPLFLVDTNKGQQCEQASEYWGRYCKPFWLFREEVPGSLRLKEGEHAIAVDCPLSGAVREVLNLEQLEVAEQ